MIIFVPTRFSSSAIGSAVQGNLGNFFGRGMTGLAIVLWIKRCSPPSWIASLNLSILSFGMTPPAVLPLQNILIKELWKQIEQQISYWTHWIIKHSMLFQEHLPCSDDEHNQVPCWTTIYCYMWMARHQLLCTEHEHGNFEPRTRHIPIHNPLQGNKNVKSRRSIRLEGTVLLLFYQEEASTSNLHSYIFCLLPPWYWYRRHSKLLWSINKFLKT